MALDRFIRFPKHRPSRENTERVLKNFLGEAGRVEWREDQRSFYISLPGSPGFPFEGISDIPQMGRYSGNERWIEIFYDAEQFDVITRQQDEFTNVVANGIAQMFARYWEGDVE